MVNGWAIDVQNPINKCSAAVLQCNIITGDDISKNNLTAARLEVEYKQEEPLGADQEHLLHPAGQPRPAQPAQQEVQQAASPPR